MATSVSGSRPGREASRVEVLEAQDGHAEAIAEFFRQVWNPAATPESVVAARREGARRNLAEPGTPPPTWIAVQSGRCLGYVTTIPVRLWDGTAERPAYWIKGLMVLPEFRGGPIGYLVLKAAAARLPLTGGLAVALPARRLFEALGYTDLGAVPNYVRPLSPHRILARLEPSGLGLERLPNWVQPMLKLAQRSGVATAAGWLAGVGIRGTAAALRLPTFGFDAGDFGPLEDGAQLDALWHLARTGYRSAVVRDAAHLRQRYAGGGGSPYLWLAARKRGRLAGVAIVRRPRDEGDERLKGLRVAALADLLYPVETPAAGLAVLGAVERAARSVGAEAILAMSSAPSLERLLRRQGYFPRSGNVHLLFRDRTGITSTFASSLAEWWLSRGDGAADEGF